MPFPSRTMKLGYQVCGVHRIIRGYQSVVLNYPEDVGARFVAARPIPYYPHGDVLPGLSSSDASGAEIDDRAE